MTWEDQLLERQYYCHLENFPVHNQLPDGAEEMLQSALGYGCLGMGFFHNSCSCIYIIQIT
jgi:hypothetical protein